MIPSPEAGENRQQSRILLGRRPVIGVLTAAGLAGVAAAYSCSGIGIPFAFTRRRNPALESLLAKSQQIGNEAISFENAQGLVPDAAGVYTAFFPSNNSADYLASHTYLVRYKEEEYQSYEDEWMKRFLEDDQSRNQLPNPKVIQFWNDYPQFAGNQRYEQIVRSTSAGVSASEGAFVSVNAANQAMRGPNTLGFRNAQAYKIQSDTLCEPAVPFNAFIFELFHEYFHQEVRTDTRIPLDPPLVEAARNYLISAGQPSDGYTRGYKAGLLVGILSDNSNNPLFYLPGFDEFASSFLAANLMRQIGLPYWISGRIDTMPRGLANFQKVMDQAGITSKQLFGYKKRSEVLEVMVRLAYGSISSRYLDDGAKVELGFRFFKAFNAGEYVFEFDETPWERRLKDHYPTLVLPQAEKADVLQGVTNRNEIGCINADTLFPQLAAN